MTELEDGLRRTFRAKASHIPCSYVSNAPSFTTWNALATSHPPLAVLLIPSKSRNPSF